MSLREQILDISRQNQIGELSPFFSAQLDKQIIDGRFFPQVTTGDTLGDLETVKTLIIERLSAYREKAGVDVVVLGMSGGVDSALTAALFKAAGWIVIGYALPIHQNPNETARGIEACKALGIQYKTVELSGAFNDMRAHLSGADVQIDGGSEETTAIKIRLGNIRARLRMITLYNMASMYGGIVASTDNFSELGAGFWTLHGDVGDVAPIQGINKSWEVPMLAKMMNVPESTWRAKPTDGLGISDGDEAQLGCSYLEWDLMMNWLLAGDFSGAQLDQPGETRARAVHKAVLKRVGKSWFKRMNPFNFDHPFLSNVDRLARWEAVQTVPQGI